jgi:NTE family protein
LEVRGRSSKVDHRKNTSSGNPNNRNEIEAGEPTKGSNGKKEKLVVFAGPKQIVYEGEKVQLEGFCNLDQSEKANNNIVYDWYFISGKSDTEISQKEFKGIKNPTFTAPYVDFRPDKENDQNVKDKNIRTEKYKTFSKLTFQLIATNKSTNLKSDPSDVIIIVTMVQRALILQGGGALGAYELGAYKALSEKLKAKDGSNSENVRKNRPLFDIIAGTSIGALNAALITRSVVDGIRNSEDADNFNIQKIWDKSVQELEKFWLDITLPFPSLWISKSNPLFTKSWNLWSKSASYYLEYLKDFSSLYYQGQPPNLQANYLNPFYLFLRPDLYTQPADVEAARRFFAWLLYPYASLARIITPNFIQPDTKFFAGIPPFIRYDNRPLVNVIEKNYWDSKRYPISTDYLKGEPRLLLVSVDILDATSALTFDSYLRKTQYPKGEIDERENKEDDSSYRTNQKQQEEQRLIEYSDGITMEHVRASMSPQTVIDYPKFEDIQNQQTRYLWDGAFLSNTPLRELLHLHRYYWHDVKKVEHVPHLEVYIINLYPTVERNQIDPPKDADTIQDREIDIRFHDRTRYDVKVANMITDYLILHGQLKNLAIKCINALADDDIKKALQDKFETEYKKLLDETEYKKPHSTKRSMKHRTYRDLVEGRFDVTKVIYVNRLDDGQTIFGKAFEFSRETMENLRVQGYKDAQVAFDFAVNPG